jgi:gamma-glutamylcyclotransferase
MIKLPDVINSRFYYFAFGSNLLEKRLKIQNQSAEKVGIGVLKSYLLNFGCVLSSRWNGSSATITEHDPDSEVVGMVWTIEIDQLGNLDHQEGVHANIYRPLNVPVQMGSRSILCRTFQLVNNPPLILDLTKAPFERQPSYTYLSVIVRGAEENNFPEKYVKFLRSIKHNGNKALDQELLHQLKDLKYF